MEQVSTNNIRRRKPTVLIHVGRVSLSRQAFLLGFALILLQIADGLLTYAGLKTFGVHMEGNIFLREFMLRLGSVSTALFITKLFAIGVITWLTFQAHENRWIRPFLGLMCGIFLSLAVIPWSMYILRGV